MTVKELIKELRKMPPNARVGFACSDQSEFEVSDWCESVWHQTREMALEADEYPDREHNVGGHQTMGCLMANGPEWVVIRG